MKQSFINKIITGARKGSQAYGVLPSLVIAQAILESDWGRSDLATKANNLFGIKDNSNWNGCKVLFPTKEFINNRWIDTESYFRKYDSLDDSILDHAKFLTKPRYKRVINATNYKIATREVFRAGYATDPNYPEKLNEIIEQNELYKYDEGVDNMHEKTIVIDAGHGGRDPGAVNGVLKEKDRALTYALKLGKALEKQGITVVYTRTTDEFIKLQDRSRISNNANATLFVSIHLNSFSDTNANGLETLYFPTSIKGKQLATDVQNAIVSAGLCNSDRGIKPRGNLSVLKGTNAPAILIELGFISNAKDVQLLADKEDEIVQALVKGISKYLGVEYKEKPKEKSDKVKIEKDGKVVEVDGFLDSGTHYVKVREVFEKLGYTVGWNQEKQLIVIK